MAHVKAWSTKEDVLKDIAKASGKRPRMKDDLAEGYLVIGDAPPPVIPENEAFPYCYHYIVPNIKSVFMNAIHLEDAEMQMLFGEAASRKAIQTEEDATPDLAGIQQMIRMMQEFNSGDDDDCNDGDAEVIAISKVSRLNPNVQEFKPKGFFSPRPIAKSSNNLNSPSKSYNSKNIDSNVVTQTVNVITEESKKETKVKGKDSGDNNDSNLVNIKIDENKDEEIATTLKNQISDAAKSDSYEYKKQKNVAIATLLRLYAKNNVLPKQSVEPIKLITPEYFEGKIESPPDVKVEHALRVGSTDTSSTPEPKDSSTTLPSCSTLGTSSSSIPVQSSPRVKLDPEIKKSIDKVNRWLEEPTKRKSPAVCLGPIAFKRKQPMNCKSPISDSIPKAPKPANQLQKYQPSKYAADLGKKYLERSKAIVQAEKDVNWMNLDKVLKQKDLELAKKRLEEQSSTSS